MNRLHNEPHKTAIVLGSGGFKVIGQFGALRIIEREQIPFDSMYCVSGGNFIGGLFLANGCTTGPGEKLWQEAVSRPADVFEYRNVLHMAASPLKMPSLCKIGPILVLVKMIDIPKLVAQSKQFVTSTVRVPNRKEVKQGMRPETVYFTTRDPGIQQNPDTMGWAIAGSCGIAGVFDSVPVPYRNTHCQYIDGAYQKALPIQKAIDDGHDTIIVVRSQSESVIRPYPRSWLDRISYADRLRNNEIEEDKIQLARALNPDINLFVIEPQWLPETLTTTTFRSSDGPEAMAHVEMMARRVLTPLIEYHQEKRRNADTAALL